MALSRPAVVVDSHIQRTGTEETTVTQQVIDRLITCQPRSWPQRGTKANGSHHGGSPLLKPKEIQITTKPLTGPTNKVIKNDKKKCFLALGGLHEDMSCDILQAIVPTNVETVHLAFLSRYFQRAYFISVVGAGKRGVY